MKNIIISIFPAILIISTIPIRYDSFLLDFSITSFLFLILSLFLYHLKFLNNKSILLYSIFGYCTIGVIILLLDGMPSSLFITNYLAFGLAIFFAYLIATSNFMINKIVFISFFCLILILYTKVFYKYVANYQNAGTFTGIINKKTNFKLIAIDENGNNFEFNNSKIYLLDFWFAGCSACLKEFPNFEEFYLMNKKNSNLEIASIRIPILKQDNLDSLFFKKMKEQDYSFPVYTNVNKIDSVLKITTYPTVVVCNKDSIFFKGSLNLAKEYLIEHKLISTEYD